jgi:hypothetical protein
MAIASPWLSPDVPRPVAPSGTPMLELVATPAPAGEASDSLKPKFVAPTPDELVVLAEPHADDSDAPPPSNELVELMVGHGAASGLIPGGSSSVAPIGILDMGAAVCASEPSGDVAPMPGVELVCADSALKLPIQTIAAKMQMLRVQMLPIKGSHIAVLRELCDRSRIAKPYHLANAGRYGALA